MAVPKFEEIYTYSDWKYWEGRWELIEGTAYDMSPAPSYEHQRISADIFLKLKIYLKDKNCKVFYAPLDVFLKKTNNEKDTVVQPDILVVCDPEKLESKGVNGSPDLCIEIVSPSTLGKDTREKLLLYEKHGVKEYWIVFPKEEAVFVYFIENQIYSKPLIFSRSIPLESVWFQGLTIDLNEIFGEKKEEE